MKDRIRILFVEDHADTAITLTKLLERRGHEIRVAHNVADAIAICADEKFDLLLADIGLPDGSGCDLMRELRKTCPIKGIALTGYGMSDDVDDSYAAGFSEHLTKPISMDALEIAIRRVTDGNAMPAI